VENDPGEAPHMRWGTSGLCSYYEPLNVLQLSYSVARKKKKREKLTRLTCRKYALTLQLQTAHILSAHATLDQKMRSVQDLKEQKNK
jgi:hypothetical protein